MLVRTKKIFQINKWPVPVYKSTATGLFLISILFLLFSFTATAQVDTTVLKKTLPKAGRMHNDKPIGKGWVNLLQSPAEWNFENAYWQFTDSSFHG